MATEHICRSFYLESGDAELFTLLCLPSEEGRFPVVIGRSPYVDSDENVDEATLRERYLAAYASFLSAGYAVIFQHCRGRGKSTGDCVPYIYEREDGLALQAWVREQDFYLGEIYLMGASYTASVHLVTAPFAPDIKGAVLEVQDCERYNCNYRNGFYKMGLHGGWYMNMYKKKKMPSKPFATDAYRMLPLSGLSRAVLGESAEDFDEILRHPERDDPFWSTRFGGGEAHAALAHAGIPILLVTGQYDIYTGGVFDMWRTMDETTRAMSALAVHPFDHGGAGTNQPVVFEDGTLRAHLGEYKLKWLEAIRGRGEFPLERGKVTYYNLFDGWHTDDFYDADASLRFPLGEGCVSYKYNPFAPASFKGGLSANFGGNAWQDQASRYDVVTVHTPVFERDIVLKGKMTASLSVASDCEDTCFYMRLSLCKEGGDYGLRDDITKISNVAPAYIPGERVTLPLSFDEIAVTVKAGERLRVDISSSAYPHYVPHTNKRGLFSEQSAAVVATNTVDLAASYIELPVVGEKE